MNETDAEQAFACYYENCYYEINMTKKHLATKQKKKWALFLCTMRVEFKIASKKYNQ